MGSTSDLRHLAGPIRASSGSASMAAALWNDSAAKQVIGREHPGRRTAKSPSAAAPPAIFMCGGRAIET